VKRALALAEWRRAQEALRAAEVLVREACYADTISRTYYAVFHAAKAALHTLDIAADTHAAVRRMFGLHLVKSGAIERAWSSPLAESLDDRLAADYDPEVAYSQRDARRECTQARKFLGRIRQYLLGQGLSQAELRRRPRRK
jgi:uncharacterized protein